MRWSAWIVGSLVAAVALGSWAAGRSPSAAPVSLTSRVAHHAFAVPLAAEGPISAALGRHDPALAARTLAGGRITLVDHRLGLAAYFTRRGAAVAVPGGWRWSLGLRAIGSGGLLERVTPIAPVATGNTVSFARSAVSEWYANGPLGLEQGFTVARRPAGVGPLTLELGLPRRLQATIGTGGHALSLARGGRPVLRYGGLLATDARGRSLAARLVLARGAVQVRVVDRGASYPVKIDPFVENARLTANDTNSLDLFGESVAISGDTIAVGAPGHAMAGTFVEGAVYVFVKPTSGWASASQTAELTASDAHSDQLLGTSVAIDGGSIAAGASELANDQGPAGPGAVYVFVKPPAGWADEHEAAKLTASDGASGDGLGFSTAISADTVVAGAPHATIGLNSKQGAVYVFTKPVAGWSSEHQRAKLPRASGAAGDQLGTSVSVSAGTIAAGAPDATVAGHAKQGVADVFTGSGASWSQRAELTASDGAAGDLLGAALAGTPDTIAVGAPAATVSGHASQGAVYVFSEPPGGWATATQTAKLTASDGAANDGLGGGVPAAVAQQGGQPGAPGISITESAIAAGAPQAHTGSGAGLGAAYLFVKPASGWVDAHETAKASIQTAHDDGFGVSTALEGETLVAGAPVAPGEAYVMTYSPTGTTTTTTTTAPPPDVPVIRTPPAITGDPSNPGDQLACSQGSWSGAPSMFTYRWSADGKPITGANGSTYVVQISDEALPLTCTVIASNAAGASAPATSASRLVAVPGTLGCPKPSGRLGGLSLGPLRLRMTRAAAHRKLPRFKVTPGHFDSFCLYAGFGIRVRYPSPKLLRALPKRKRKAAKGRIILALTANRFYSLGPARLGARFSPKLDQKLHLGKPFKIGINSWYLAQGKRSRSVVKVQHGLIYEIGIASKQLTPGRAAERQLLLSFKGK